MTVSSRTPEGRPNRCPLCDADIVLEPSLSFGDAPCPQCGQLLWFLNSGDETRIIKPRPGEHFVDRIVRVLADQLGVPADENRRSIDDNEFNFFQRLSMDSLDFVELVVALDDENLLSD